MDNLYNRAGRRRRKGQGGFTLIELLVVIAILGVLAAIVVINVTGVKGNAQSASCKSDTEAIQTAADGYYVQNSVYPVNGGDKAAPAAGDVVDTAELLTGTNPYLQAAPQTGESFAYANSTGTVAGSVNGAVCQTG